MDLTLMVKLQPTPEQSAALLETMEQFNAACNAIAEVAFRERTANKIRLQKLVYQEIRKRFGLSAQMAVLAISKVAEAYKRDKSKRRSFAERSEGWRSFAERSEGWRSFAERSEGWPSFRKHGAIVYDQRVLSWKGLDRVSILTL